MRDMQLIYASRPFGYEDLTLTSNLMQARENNARNGITGALICRDDVFLHQQYMADIADNSRKAIDTVDPTPYFQKYGENTWAGVKAYLDAVADSAAAPVIEKYTGVLGAADVFTAHTALWMVESIRLDAGVGIQVHPLMRSG